MWICICLLCDEQITNCAAGQLVKLMNYRGLQRNIKMKLSHKYTRVGFALGHLYHK